LVARGMKLGEEPIDRRTGGGGGRQEQRREEPSRARAPHRDVVGIDVERVPADLGGRERDRIAGGDEISVAHVDDRGIFTDPGPDDDAGLLELVLAEARLQRVGTELADWQQLHAGTQYTWRRRGAIQIRSLSRSAVRSSSLAPLDD